MNLRIISLFEDLPAAELARIEAQCSIRSFAKHEEIYGERETTTDIFFILAGTVRVTSFTESGREVIFSEISAGGIFGEFSAIDRLPRSATIVAVSDCRLARMSSQAFFALLQKNSDVCVHVVELLVAKIRTMSERVVELSALAVRERLRRELVRLATAGGKPEGRAITIFPSPTHQDIAARIGSHREAVTREFNRLKHEKVLEMLGPRSIRIIDMQRLRTFDA